jgi:hypothetical protein
VAGNCIDQANLPPHQDFRRKVRAKADRTVERAGLVWVYMGARAEPPPLPGLDILDVPEPDVPGAAPGGEGDPAGDGVGMSLISSIATTCRRSRAISTHRISAFCTPDTSTRTTCRRTTHFATPLPRALRSTTSPTQHEAPRTPPTAPPGRVRPTGAAIISCFPFGASNPQANLPPT